MKRAEASPLTLVRAAAALPGAATTVDDWRREARQAWAAPQGGLYRGLTEIMYRQTGGDAAAACAVDAPPASAAFRDAGAQTQCELAQQALQAMLGGQDEQATRRCKLAVYGTASVDEHFFQSTISRLAAVHGFSALPHFGLAQLQGATLPAAAEIIDAMLPADGDAALFVSADKWPLPFPRQCDDLAVLGDGAAALWFARGAAPGLRYLGGRQASCAPFVSGGRRGQPAAARIDSAALLGAAVAAITLALAEQGLEPADIDVWVASGLHAGLERALRQRLRVQASTLVEPALEDGFLGAAAMPALLAEVLRRGVAGEFAPATLVLSWGASFGGGIGVAMWRVVTQREH